MPKGKGTRRIPLPISDEEAVIVNVPQEWTNEEITTFFSDPQGIQLAWKKFKLARDAIQLKALQKQREQLDGRIGTLMKQVAEKVD